MDWCNFCTAKIIVNPSSAILLQFRPILLEDRARYTKDGKVEIDDQVKASLLSDFFQSVFTREPSAKFVHPSIRQPTSPPSTLPHPIPSLPSLTEEPLFSSTILRAELLRLKPAKSPGPDRIPALALRELANELCKPLSAIFQKSFEDGELPEEWKYVFDPLPKRLGSDSASFLDKAAIQSANHVCELLASFRAVSMVLSGQYSYPSRNVLRMEPTELHFLDCSRSKLYETWTSKTNTWLSENGAFLAALRQYLSPAIFLRHMHVVTLVSESCASLGPDTSPTDVINLVDTCLQKTDQRLELSLAFVFVLDEWQSQPSIGELTKFALQMLTQRLSVGAFFHKVVALHAPTLLQVDFGVHAENACRPSQIDSMTSLLRAALQAYRGCTGSASVAAARMLLGELNRMAYWLSVQSVITPLNPSAFESFNYAFCFLLITISGSTRSASVASEFMVRPLFLMLRKAVAQCASQSVPTLTSYLSGLTNCRRFCKNMAHNLHVFDLVNPCLLLFDRIFLLSVYQQSDSEQRRTELWDCVSNPSISASVERWSRFWLVADKNGNPYVD
nr:unnamed protein product [Spirometra erinaceieuropaei]